MRKVLITGASGQLGKEFVKVLSSKGIDFVALGKKDLDIANFERVYKTLKEINPFIVINCSAYNQEEWDEVYSKVYSKYVTTNQRQNDTEDLKLLVYSVLHDILAQYNEEKLKD